MIGGAYQYSEPRAAGLQDTGRDSEVPDIDSWFGIITFSWFTHVIHNAQKRVLQTTDATPLPSNCDATDTRMQLWNVWSETLDEDTYTTGIEGEKKRKSLLRAIIEIYGFEYACIGIHLFLASIFSFFGPILLHRLVVLAEQPQPNTAQITLCALWLFLSRLMAAIFNTQYSFLSTAMSVRIGAAIKGCLFQKVLCLSTKSRRAYTTGIFSNLYTTDVERITDMVIQAHRFWVLPLQILVSMLLLYGVVGYAMFWGLFAVISVLMVNNYIARLSKVANDKVQAAKDIRMSAVSACFSSSLIIKLNVWENKFEQKIQKARNDELVHVWESLLIAAVNICLLWLAPCLVSSATIAAYGFSGDAKAAEIFTALSLFKSLQDPFRDLPGIITQYFQMKTSLERLQVLFEMPEKKHKNESMISPATIHSGDVYIKKCTFTWDTNGKHTSKLGYRLVVSEAQILSRGKLMVVRGATGSGKSSFVSALLGDMYLQTDKPVSIDGSIGYTSQITWIQNDTVLSNILMGLPLVPAKLQRIIDACTLGPDLKEFPLGLNQPIGERGVGLSGGQKARVALARCMYSDADIIILDDVFAALDTVVGRSIFEKGVLQLLKCKTVILVTHNIDILNSLQIDVVCTVEDGVVTFAPGPKLEDKDNASVDAKEYTDFNNDSDSATDSDLNEDFKLERNHSVNSYSNNRNKFIAKKRRAKSRKVRVSVYNEERAEGNISAHVYKGYLNAMGGWKVVAFLCVVQTVWQILGVSSDLWLAYWTSHDDAWQAIHVHRNVNIYATLSIASGLTVFVRTYTISKGGYDAAKSLFERMNHAVLYAPMSWIDVNPSGRILNRFSDDVSKIDLNMPFAVVAIITKWLVIIAIPISYAYVTVMRCVSPVLSYMSEISVGASIINAFDAQQRYIDENDRKVNYNSTMMYCAATAQAWFVIRVQFLGCIMLFFIVIFAFISQNEDDIGASLIGLSLAYGLQLSDELQFVVMILSWFENSMVSPERVLQYCAIKSEGTDGIELNPLQQNTTKWVTQGRITYRGVSFRYQPTSEDILIDLNFDVLAGQKIGIVGRTGSGKSSLSMSLFRVAELRTGSIYIDGINISDIPLSQLRAGVEIIPQSPIVLKGTVRMNVDPFDQYTDTEVHEALRKTYMLKSITNLAKSQAEAEDSDANANDLNKPFGILYTLLDESGGNLSVGEKQLLVMARALLSQSKILILDEATANVDSDTDVHIRLLLQKEFTNSTVLTIAHRLHTVMGCDRILVMEQGRIAEYDTPQNLLDIKGSIFENLVAAEEAQRK
eukprot:GSChrysophyteH2.ASY1.ANO1.1146.1 assembled CDS